MKKTHRILAFIAAVLLVLLYLCTLIFAFIDSSVSSDLLKASIAATIILPVLLYAYLLIYRITNNKHDDSDC